MHQNNVVHRDLKPDNIVLIRHVLHHLAPMFDPWLLQFQKKGV
jgi:tRNA A-37 threonylcarbamoyl transferase component Bud32